MDELAPSEVDPAALAAELFFMAFQSALENPTFEPDMWQCLESARLGIAPIMGGWTVLPIGPYTPFRIDVMKMTYNWRIVETYPDGMQYGRFWCYARTDNRLEDVVEAARAWMGDPETEPEGWIKSWDGRIRGRLLKEYEEAAERIVIQNAITGKKELT